MARALWLSGVTPPKKIEVNGEEVAIVMIKNATLEERLLPSKPELMTVKAVLEWAELVRRVATGYGVTTILIDRSLILEPMVLTLRYTLKPYRLGLRVID